jgi:site-specific DNA-methyltransferase (adenine-specific)
MKKVENMPHVNAALEELTLGYQGHSFKNTRIIHADSFEWLSALPKASLHAIVTDPPYGVKEYDFDQLEKMNSGVGGIWRLPPAFDGNVRAPLPRFTALDKRERESVDRFFFELGRKMISALRPGGHVFLASNSFLSQLVFSALIRSGLEFRGEMIRLVRTMRGGDRPKNAETEFSNVCSLPRGCYEPWGIFRNPMPPKMTVADCLREFQTGGLRRLEDGNPFCDVVISERTSKYEREVAKHPSIKPQSLMRQLVRASLPLGTGVVADPFMGSGSTVAAAEHLGLNCVGVERHREYFDMACKAVPQLSTFKANVPASSDTSPNSQIDLI